MGYVVVTRLGVRKGRYLPAFLAASARIALQARRSPGYRGGYLRADARGGFWTVTTWDSARDMRGFTSSGMHAVFAPRIGEWSDDAVFAGWQQAGVPGYREASRRLLAAPTRLDLPHQTSRPTPAAAVLAATLPVPARRGRVSRSARTAAPATTAGRPPRDRARRAASGR